MLMFLFDFLSNKYCTFENLHYYNIHLIPWRYYYIVSEYPCWPIYYWAASIFWHDSWCQCFHHLMSIVNHPVIFHDSKKNQISGSFLTLLHFTRCKLSKFYPSVNSEIKRAKKGNKAWPKALVSQGYHMTGETSVIVWSFGQ